MKTIRTLARAAALCLLLAPLAHAEEQAQIRPPFYAIMVGGNFPDDRSHAVSGECFFVNGFMRNRYFGYQLEFDATNYDLGSTDGVPGKFYAIAASLRLAFPIALVEPYVLAGAGVGVGDLGASEGTSPAFPLHAAAGLDFNFNAMLVGLEARRVWLTADGVDFDSLLVMGKFGFLF